MIISSTSDFREAARRRLPPFLFHYADGGAYAEETMRRNVADLAGLALRQQVLRNVADIDLSTILFGERQSLPVALGPIGIGGMFRRRGELQAARAAHGAGIPFTLSTVSICSLAEVTKAAPGPNWFQLYVIRDRAFMRDLLATAREQGAKALVFTVDMPVPGARYRDAHSGMSGPNAPLRRMVQTMTHPCWAWDVGVRGRPHSLGNVAHLFDRRTGLLASTVHGGMRGQRLEAIPGAPPDLAEVPTACSFAPRCKYVEAQCLAGPPALLEAGDSHLVRCVVAA